jgi:transposase
VCNYSKLSLSSEHPSGPIVEVEALALDRQPLTSTGGGRLQRSRSEAASSHLLLPSYSPDFNPIEEAFSKIKGLVRKAEARTREALVEAIGSALSAVTSRDARGFFEHCGYRMPIQSLC